MALFDELGQKTRQAREDKPEVVSGDGEESCLQKPKLASMLETKASDWAAILRAGSQLIEDREQ